MRADEPEQAAEAVQRLDHRRDETRVAAIAGKNLSDRQFQAAYEFVGLLFFLIGHASPPESQTIHQVRRTPVVRGKKGMEQIRETGTMRRGSAIRGSQSTRDTAAEVAFGLRADDVHAAVDEAVDQRANDLRAIQQFAGFAAVGGREAVEVHDLPVEQHDGHFGPRFVVNRRPPGAGSGASRSYEAGMPSRAPFGRHRKRLAKRKYTGSLLIAQTQQFPTSAFF